MNRGSAAHYAFIAATRTMRQILYALLIVAVSARAKKVPGRRYSNCPIATPGRAFHTGPARSALFERSRHDHSAAKVGRLEQKSGDDPDRQSRSRLALWTPRAGRAHRP